MNMRYRALGGTGIEVSAYCLGAMMFGKVGNPDHDDCVRIIHTALARFDPSLPATAAKLAVLEKLVEVAEGIEVTLPELAVAFTCAHPSVTSTIIGPRTMEQLEATLKGASLTLEDATLDRIDSIVPPGTNVYVPDGVWQPRPLAEASLRRRPPSDRSAG